MNTLFTSCVNYYISCLIECENRCVQNDLYSYNQHYIDLNRHSYNADFVLFLFKRILQNYIEINNVSKIIYLINELKGILQIHTY